MSELRNVNVAVIGLGQRGSVNLKLFLKLPAVTVVAVSDLCEDRCKDAADMVEESTGVRPLEIPDYREVLKRDDVEAVVICTSWATHVQVTIDAMKAGKAVGMEVGGAYSLEECYELVEAYEETKTPFMFLENCCYGKNEMLVTNMVEAGLFGEVVHCHGAYGHDLREEICTGKEKRHYRLHEYINRNCENYPTHELGPIAKILKINRGNRMVKLVSVSSKAVGLEQYVNERKDTIENKALIGQKFKQGDMVNTLITCENGETISLRLDTTLPRSYSREFTVHGTKGLYEENTNSVFLDGDREDFNTNKFYKEHYDTAKAFEEQYLPSYWKEITEEKIKAGHGGMDYFLFSDFFRRLRDGREMPIDVYDAAAWMCVTCLSEQSIAGGCMPIDVPDFTKGAWKTRKETCL